MTLTFDLWPPKINSHPFVLVNTFAKFYEYAHSCMHTTQTLARYNRHVDSIKTQTKCRWGIFPSPRTRYLLFPSRLFISRLHGQLSVISLSAIYFPGSVGGGFSRLHGQGICYFPLGYLFPGVVTPFSNAAVYDDVNCDRLHNAKCSIYHCHRLHCNS